MYRTYVRDIILRIKGVVKTARAYSITPSTKDSYSILITTTLLIN